MIFIKNLKICIPGSIGIALPIFIDGECTLPELPEQKFWALKYGVYDFLTEEWYYPVTTSLYKHSLEDIWKEVVKPIDSQLDGTEYLFYRDALGEWKQGYNYYGEGLHKKMWLFGDGGPLLRDIIILIGFIQVLVYLGLARLITTFMNNMAAWASDWRVRHIVKTTKELMEKDYNLLQNFSVETDGDFTTINTSFDSLKSLLGVKLQFLR